MPLASNDLLSQIRENAYAVVPFPVSKAEFQSAMDCYVAFLALPQDVKDGIYFNIDLGDERGADVGYQIRRREAGQIDNREFFHYHPDAEERFREARQTRPELDRLLIAMKHINDHATAAMEEVIRALDTEFPGLHERMFVTGGRAPNFALRFLKYDVANPGEFLAKGHYDRGAYTLALAESAPGLRMGIDDLHLRDVVHDEGQALFMPGLNSPEFTGGAIPATWHDVVQKSDDTYSTDIARWAIVFFADTYIKPKTTFEDRHTPKRIHL